MHPWFIYRIQLISCTPVRVRVRVAPSTVSNVEASSLTRAPTHPLPQTAALWDSPSAHVYAVLRCCEPARRRHLPWCNHGLPFGSPSAFAHEAAGADERACQRPLACNGSSMRRRCTRAGYAASLAPVLETRATTGAAARRPHAQHGVYPARWRGCAHAWRRRNKPFRRTG